MSGLGPECGLNQPSIGRMKLMGIAEFIIGPAEGRTRWLHPSYALIFLSIPSNLHDISDFQKLSLTPDPNHLLIARHPVPREGALAIVTDVGAGSDGRGCCD
jgi:hypothetical protein